MTVLQSAEGIDLCWVVVNVNEITVDSLTVRGVLHFEDEDVTVKARYILVLVSFRFVRCLLQLLFVFFKKKRSVSALGNSGGVAKRLKGTETIFIQIMVWV